MNAKEYAEQLAQSAGLSQEEKDSLLKVVANEKAAKALEEGVMLRSDYSRQSDALKAEGQKTAKYYSDLVAWEAQRKTEWEQAMAGVDKGAPGQVINGEYITKKDLEAIEQKYQQQAKQQEGSFITIAKVMGRLASRHANEFHEELDTDALEKIAVEKQLPLMQAYDALMAPRRTEAQTAARAAEIAKAKEDAVREYRSTHKLPIDSGPREQHVIFDRDPKRAGIEDYVPNSGQLSHMSRSKLRDSFVEEFEKAGVNTSGT
jgi:hypothetical protein